MADTTSTPEAAPSLDSLLSMLGVAGLPGINPAAMEKAKGVKATPVSGTVDDVGAGKVPGWGLDVTGAPMPTSADAPDLRLNDRGWETFKAADWPSLTSQNAGLLMGGAGADFPNVGERRKLFESLPPDQQAAVRSKLQDMGESSSELKALTPSPAKPAAAQAGPAPGSQQISLSDLAALLGDQSAINQLNAAFGPVPQISTKGLPKAFADIYQGENTQNVANRAATLGEAEALPKLAAVTALLKSSAVPRGALQTALANAQPSGATVDSATGGATKTKGLG